MLDQRCDRCGLDLGRYATGAFIPRTRTQLGMLDLCEDCRKSLKDTLSKWLREKGLNGQG